MKIKLLFGIAAIAISAGVSTARAGLSVDFRFGLPLPPIPFPRLVVGHPMPVPCPPVVVVRPPVLCPPAPCPPVVVFRPPVAFCPPARVIVQPPFHRQVAVGHYAPSRGHHGQGWGRRCD